MNLINLTKYSTLTEEEFHATVNYKGADIQFKVLKTTSITNSTCYTAVSIKKISNKPNLTKGQKEKIRKMIEQKINHDTITQSNNL